jgi:transcriptional regulator with XRE-family HTH domain
MSSFGLHLFDLRSVRRQKRLTQSYVAAKLGVTQAYLSMMERHRRPVPDHLLPVFMALYGFSASVLPFRGRSHWAEMNDNELATELATLGYRGFAYLDKRQARWNPAELLLAALTRSDLETRVTEALPWVAYQYSNIDWEWAVREAKVNNVTNRLGFVVAVGRELAEKKQDTNAVEVLRDVEMTLEPAVLRNLETLCHDRMTNVERRWLEHRSTPVARKWNVLSDLSAEQLERS